MEYRVGLDKHELARYGRHLLIRDLNGIEGFKNIKSSRVAVVGAGGLGCPLCLYLASAGVGEITVIDGDTIDLSNLTRQIAFDVVHTGKNKAEVLANRMTLLNDNIRVTPVIQFLTNENSQQLLKGHQVIVDCTDNAKTRYYINEASVLLRIPLVSASAIKWDGQLSVFNLLPDSPCYRCLFPAPPDQTQSCNENGIVGPITGVMGSMQALEVLKILSGSPGVLSGRILVYNGLHTEFRLIKMRGKRASCPSCCENLFLRKPITFSGDTCVGRSSALSITTKELYNLYAEDMRRTDCLLIDVREPHEYEILNFKQAINIPMACLYVNGLKALEPFINNDVETIYVICQRGVLSNKACELLITEQSKLGKKKPKIVNIEGGLMSWSCNVDCSLPTY